MKPLIYIIILNYNGGEEIIECLKSCQEISYPNYKILVVDNASTDDSVLQIKKYFKNVKVIQNRNNLGFAAGNNIGIQYALNHGADNILLLNNDTMVSKDFLDKMVDLAEADSSIGIVVPKILYYKSDKLWEGGKKKIYYIRGRLEVITNSDARRPTDTICGTGCAMLIKREVLEKIGLLPEDYFMYFEDTDFSLKAKEAGFKIFYQPESIIWHRFNRGTSIVNQYYWYRSRVIFALKWSPNFIIKFCAFILILFRILRFFVKYQIARLTGREEKRFKIAYKATIDGLKKDRRPITITGSF